MFTMLALRQYLPNILMHVHTISLKRMLHLCIASCPAYVQSFPYTAFSPSPMQKLDLEVDPYGTDRSIQALHSTSV